MKFGDLVPIHDALVVAVSTGAPGPRPGTKHMLRMAHGRTRHTGRRNPSWPAPHHLLAAGVLTSVTLIELRFEKPI